MVLLVGLFNKTRSVTAAFLSRLGSGKPVQNPKSKIQNDLRKESLHRKRKRLIAAGIILFWMVMVALLLRREGMLPFFETSAHTVSPRVMRPGNSWMGIYLGDSGSSGTRIGFVNSSSTPDSRDGHVGVAFSVTARLQLMLLMTPTDVFVAGSAWMPEDGSRAEFDFKLRSSEHTMRIAANVENGQLVGTVYTAGEAIPFQFPVGKELLLSGAMGTTTLNLPSLKAGQEVVMDAFDPMTFSVGKARIQCVGNETIEVAGERVECKVLTTTLNGLTTKAWLAEDEEIIRAETPFGFSLRKITPEEALAPADSGENTNLLRSMAIVPKGRMPMRGAKRMTVRFSGISPDRYPPADETQTAAGDTYTITTSSGPVASDPNAALSEEYLKSDAFVQADRPKIKDLSAQIVANEKDSWQKAVRIYQWVHDNVKKVAVFSIPSALEVLESLAGDCNEHTVLYAALARAAGVPTRIAIGLVWSDTLKGFYYHAWPEVFAGRWIWMDPTLGQPIADATHIKLLNGNIEKWTQLLPYLGQLEIEVTGVE